MRKGDDLSAAMIALWFFFFLSPTFFYFIFKLISYLLLESLSFLINSLEGKKRKVVLWILCTRKLCVFTTGYNWSNVAWLGRVVTQLHRTSVQSTSFFLMFSKLAAKQTFLCLPLLLTFLVSENVGYYLELPDKLNW